MAADALAPIDETVSIPAAVRAAAAAAEAFYKAPPEPDKPVETPSDATQEAPVERAEVSADSPAPEPEPPAPPEPPTEPEKELNWEHRFKSMEGRYRKQVEINATLGNQLNQMSSALTQLQQQPERSFATPLVTDDERKAYGDDLLGVVSRQAMQTVQPHLQRLEQENQQLRTRLHNSETRDIYSILAAEIPNWGEINVNADFLAWLNLPDLYSGNVRAGMLRAAFDEGNAPRVLAFFNGFLAEHPEFRVAQSQPKPAAQAPRREAARDLKDFAAPGKARPATGPTPVAAEQPTITQKDIDRFYADVRRGVYAGRVEQKNAEEARIFAAMRDGRIRRVK